MKKSTFIIGVISSFLILLSVAMKIQHWAGARSVLIAGTILFAFGYSILLLIDKNAVAQNQFQKFVNVMTMVGMMFITITFVLKVNHWPGARVGMYLSHILLLAMIPVLFAQGSKESDAVKKMNINNSAVFLIILTAISIFLWLRSSMPV
jgi:hypothetical protein